MCHFQPACFSTALGPTAKQNTAYNRPGSLEIRLVRVSVIGCGHVGLVTGGCMAAIGHQVICADYDAELISLLQTGYFPIYEPHLAESASRSQKVGMLKFTSDVRMGLTGAEVVILCVGVPQLENGDSDFSALDSAARQISRATNPPTLVVVRSTVPVQTGRQLKHLLNIYRDKPGLPLVVASNPQFLREGTAVEDFLHPDHILFGVEDASSENILRELCAPVLTQNFRCPLHSAGCPPRKLPELIITSIQSAELIKHASNAYLASKISYSNVLADLCERLGANVQEVTRAVGLDPRIGPQFLNPGIGFGGSRLPKDLRALCHLAARAGVEAGILLAAEEVNRCRISLFFQKIQSSLWVLKDKRIGLLGLAHKAGTDDIRGSPAIDLFNRFTAAGAQVRAYDPHATDQARAAHPEVSLGADAYAVAEHADALVISTDWPEFRELDWKRIHDSMARPSVFDGRNLLSPSRMKELGFEYHSVGRPVH
jgi:UDPglucose 6-dehydrogenase